MDGELQTLVLAAIQRVDDLFRSFTERVRAILAPFGSDPLTRADRRTIRRQVDTLVGEVFGLTQRAALTSRLFDVIVGSRDIASERPFRLVIDRTREIAEAHVPGWWNRITARARRMPNDPLGRVMVALDGPVVDRQRFLRAGKLDPNRAWVNGDRYRLSDRVWRQGRNVRKGIDRVIQDGIRRGASARDIARSLEQYLNPAHQSHQYRKDGRIVRRNMTKTGGYGTWGNYPARRLARSEVSQAFLEATREATRNTPFALGMKWNLSASHPRRDICDDHAAHDEGKGRGVWSTDGYPTLPHAQCLCFATTAMPSREDVIDALISRYGV